MTIYAVNGKEPVAAWIPSLDTAGNGTTTLTDLVGSNNGTLTNMDAATDWVADTDNGGVRALQTDGTAEWLALGDIGVLPVNGAISFWARPDAIYAALYQNIFGTNAFANNSKGFRIERSSNGVTNLVVGDDVGSFPSSAKGYSLGTIPSDQWSHITIVWDTTANRITAYRDGSVVVNNVSHSFWVTNLTDIRLGVGFSTSRGFGGRHDDIRIWDQSLDATDVAYLYNSGNGRGRVVEPAPTGVTYHPLSSRSTHPLRFSI
jgi:hypothetical protein